MSCLQANFSVSEPSCTDFKNRDIRVSSAIDKLEVIPTGLQSPGTVLKIKTPKSGPVIVQGSLKSQRWREKTLQPNMVEIQSPQQLVDFLRNAGDTLVVISFYSPDCGGCRALHPKICQLSGMNPDAHFLTVNYEQHRVMCHALNVHVLPFFRFYRGAEGKLCNFSCTNATIKKLKDALSKHGGDLSGHGVAKGLEEGEMASLASLGLLVRDDQISEGIGCL